MVCTERAEFLIPFAFLTHSQSHSHKLFSPTHIHIPSTHLCTHTHLYILEKCTHTHKSLSLSDLDLTTSIKSVPSEAGKWVGRAGPGGVALSRTDVMETWRRWDSGEDLGLKPSTHTRERERERD